MLCQKHVFWSCVNEFQKEGDEVEFDSWSGRPTSTSDENVEKIRIVMRNDRRLAVRMTGELNSKKEHVRVILTEFFGIKQFV
jgi:hypothetical protein